jgi:guanylate kinase
MSLVRTGPGKLFIVSAPSGGGKTSLTRAAVKRLAEAGVPAVISISCTTRPPRPGEQDGVHYHFITDEEFERMVSDKEFFEHAQVFGHRYGTGRAATETLRAQGSHVLLDIDWQGGRQVRKQVPDAVSIFILPPSRAELERRLRTRGQDPDEVIARRMAQAREEIRHYGEYEYLIVNRDFDLALAELAGVVEGRGGPLRAEMEAQHKSLIQELLAP